MTPENRTLVARMLVHAGQDPDRLIEKAEKEKEQRLASPVYCLRQALRNQLILDKFEEIREELM